LDDEERRITLETVGSFANLKYPSPATLLKVIDEVYPAGDDAPPFKWPQLEGAPSNPPGLPTLDGSYSELYHSWRPSYDSLAYGTFEADPEGQKLKEKLTSRDEETQEFGIADRDPQLQPSSRSTRYYKTDAIPSMVPNLDTSVNLLATLLGRQGFRREPYTVDDVVHEAFSLERRGQLRPHQTRAIAFLAIMLALSGCAGLFDDVGLGKTSVVLATLEAVNELQRRNEAARRQAQAAGQPYANGVWPLPEDQRHLRSEAAISSLAACMTSVHFKPSVVVCPAAATKTWTDEIRSNFPDLTVRLWYGQANEQVGQDKSSHVPGDAYDFAKHISTLDPQDPATGKLVYVTTIATFRFRTLREVPADFLVRYDDLARSLCKEVLEEHPTLPANIVRQLANRRAIERFKYDPTAGPKEEEEELPDEEVDAPDADAEKKPPEPFARPDLFTPLPKKDQMRLKAVKSAKAKDKAKKPVEFDPLGEGEGDDVEDISQTEEDAKIGQISLIPGLIGTLVVDEAHSIKNPNTLAWMSMTHARPDRLIVISATPLYTNVVDFVGFLAAFREVSHIEQSVHASPHDELKELHDALLKDENDITTIDPRLAFEGGILHPRVYRAFTAGAAPSINLDYQTVVPPTTRALIGCRNLAGSRQRAYDGTYSLVGGDIKESVNIVIELGMSKWQSRLYDTAHEAIIQSLYRPSPSSVGKRAAGGFPPTVSTQEGVHIVRSLASHRTLQTLAAYPATSRMANNAGRLKETDGWSLEPNGGYHSFFMQTRPSHDTLPHGNRQHAAIQLACSSPAMTATCFLLAELVVRRGKKVLIFFHNPLVQFAFEQLFTLIFGNYDGDGFLSLRSWVSHSDREAAITDFDDPTSPRRIFCINSA
jgi:SNF2-related domain